MEGETRLERIRRMKKMYEKGALKPSELDTAEGVLKNFEGLKMSEFTIDSEPETGLPVLLRRNQILGILVERTHPEAKIIRDGKTADLHVVREPTQEENLILETWIKSRMKKGKK